MVSVNASWGLGIAVVGGEVTPDDYLVSKVTGEIVRRTVSSKQVEYVPDAAGRGTVRLEVRGRATGRALSRRDGARRARRGRPAGGTPLRVTIRTWSGRSRAEARCRRRCTCSRHVPSRPCQKPTSRALGLRACPSSWARSALRRSPNSDPDRDAADRRRHPRDPPVDRRVRRRGAPHRDGGVLAARGSRGRRAEPSRRAGRRPAEPPAESATAARLPTSSSRSQRRCSGRSTAPRRRAPRRTWTSARASSRTPSCA